MSRLKPRPAKIPWPYADFLRELQRLWLCWVAVIVKTAAGFAAVPAHQDHALQQRRRREALFLEFIEHDIRDVVSGVVADKIEKRERAHGVAAAELHGIINVLDGANARFEGADGIEQIWHEQAIDDEAGAIGGAHGRLAETRAESDGCFIHRWIGGDGADYFHQFHHWDGIEKMHAQETVGALREH